MATKTVRNIINNLIARLLPVVKKKVREEINKKLVELQAEIMTPEYIAQQLQPEINPDTCSDAGKEKFKEKVDRMEQKLNSIQENIQRGITFFQDREDEIASISTIKPTPPGKKNPIADIQDAMNSSQPIVETLRAVIAAAPAILAASSGPAANGTVISKTNNSVNQGKSLIKEITELFRVVPRMLRSYQKMADNIVKMIAIPKNQLNQMLSTIEMLKAFLIFIEMDFLNKCNAFTAEPNPPTGNQPQIPPDLTLDDVIQQIQETYGDMLNNLIAQGDTKAIERTYVLNQKFERIKNTQVKWKYL
jgi:hypothetical protein